ncbi:uncharacterized oxidoreductase TM_0325-like [Ylistrum balloti]|uniref:uncharacterized oxidoreductase TM_0325-like n=1 Tax=Ylistrum balloti TaxID=509963 RepID=UPI0029058BFB|nr:uncharacterized oxidoreductase TM_0325-like [Ylistrum balloti]
MVTPHCTAKELRPRVSNGLMKRWQHLTMYGLGFPRFDEEMFHCCHCWYRDWLISWRHNPDSGHVLYRLLLRGEAKRGFQSRLTNKCSKGNALHFSKLRARLCLTGRNIDNLQKVVEMCKKAGLEDSKITCVPGEITSEDDRTKILKHTIQTFGRLDVLVNNAGTITYSTTTDTTPEQYDEMMNVNTRSQFFLTQAAIPYLKETRGNIVNVSSICGQRAMAAVTAYCMSKAAMDSFTECLALELAPFGVRVNAVNPGTVISMITRRGHSAYQKEEDYRKFLDIQTTKHPIGRVGVPQDVAQAIAFLASEQASFISGQIMFVDGARHCVSSAVTTSVK